VLDGPLLTGRLLRDVGDALCKPRRKFWGLYDNMGTTPDCARCCTMLATLTAAGLVRQPTGNTAQRWLPCLAWDGLRHDPDPARGWRWSSEVCQTCRWPLTDHALLARVARYVEPFVSAAAHRLAVWPTTTALAPLVRQALTAADQCLAGQPAMAASLHQRLSRSAIQAALAAIEGM